MSRNSDETLRVEGTDPVCESSARVEGRERGEGATLIVVEEADMSGDSGETRGNNPLQDSRNVWRRTMMWNGDGES